MNDILEKLIGDYNSMPKKNNSSCLKCAFQYNNVQVRFYFDYYYGFDANATLILFFSEDYYFSSLNVEQLYKSQYLDNIPSKIITKIRKYNSENKKYTLNEFFETLRENILNSKYEKNYTYDDEFNEYRKMVKKNIDLPFFHYLRKQKMTYKFYCELLKKINIDAKILKIIKQNGFNIIRTGDINERKNILNELEAKNIKYN